MTGILCAAALGSRSGGSPFLDSQTVTVGSSYSESGSNYTARSGYASGVMGNCTTGFSALYSNVPILGLEYIQTGVIGFPPDNTLVAFIVTGVVANSGWTTMTVNGTTFARVAAGFSTTGGNSQWSWGSAVDPFTGSSVTWS